MNVEQSWVYGKTGNGVTYSTDNLWYHEKIARLSKRVSN